MKVWTVFLLALTVVSAETPLSDFKRGDFAMAVSTYFYRARQWSNFVLPLKIKLPEVFRKGFEDKYNSAICEICEAVAGEFIEIRRQGGTKEEIEKAIIDICVDMNIESKAVCEGAIRLNSDIYLHIVDNKKDLVPDRICAIVFQGYGCKSTQVKDWSINIAPGYSKIPPTKNASKTPVTVLQLTDIHYDPLYVAGGNANCGEPLCCQIGQGEPKKPEDACGYWSDYRDADTPWWMISNSFKHIIEHHQDVDYIYYTGDIISHRVWDTSIQQNKNDIQLILNEMHLNFPNTPVFPILGNHEPHPVNVFIPGQVPKITTQWVFDLAAKQWLKWLPEETMTTIRRGGYYTVLVRPGFRIIALNSNVCYVYNWWLIYDDVDQFGQLQWLADTLYEAEKNGERVHILSHIPSGDGTCLKSWSKQYRRIIDRFAHTILAQFNGHTHNDQFVLYYNKTNPLSPINIAFNGGSLTPFSNLNPNYKIYHVDPQTYEVLDIDTWVFNLTSANLTPERTPEWYKLYSFRSAYGVRGFMPNHIDELTTKFALNHDLLKTYNRFFVREADTAMTKGCDDACQKKHLCAMVVSEHGDNTQCDKLLELHSSNLIR